MQLSESKTIVAFASLLLITSIVTSSQAQDSTKVVGTVKDEMAAPVLGAHISLYSLDRVMQTTSDSAGHFEFAAVSSGTYEFEVLAPGFKLYRKTIVFDRGRATTTEKPVNQTAVLEIGAPDSPRNIISVDLTMAVEGPCQPPPVIYQPRQPNGSAVAGIVIEYPPKTPVMRATVQLFAVKGAQIAQQQTNERGEFQFKQIAPGHYYVTLQHPAYNEMRSTDFWVARENTTSVTLDPVPLGKIRVCQ